MINKNPWGCWKSGPVNHPFIPQIADVACGFDDRLTDPRCAGCHRQRPEAPRDQLAALDKLGDAAEGQHP